MIQYDDETPKPTFVRYEKTDCPFCGRHRWQLLSDGTHQCEKCLYTKEDQMPDMDRVLAALDTIDEAIQKQEEINAATSEDPELAALALPEFTGDPDFVDPYFRMFVPLSKVSEDGDAEIDDDQKGEFSAWCEQHAAKHEMKPGTVLLLPPRDAKDGHDTPMLMITVMCTENICHSQTIQYEDVPETEEAEPIIDLEKVQED